MMSPSSHMPLWAVLYAGLLFASATGTIMISGRKSPLYIVGELLSGFFAISFFLFYYQVIPYPATLSTVVIMVLFILFQEAWVNKELYSFVEIEFETIPQHEKKYVLGFMFFFIILLLAPLFWVTLSVFQHYLINPL